MCILNIENEFYLDVNVSLEMGNHMFSIHVNTHHHTQTCVLQNPSPRQNKPALTAVQYKPDSEKSPLS